MNLGVGGMAGEPQGVYGGRDVGGKRGGCRCLCVSSFAEPKLMGHGRHPRHNRGFPSAAFSPVSYIDRV